MAVWLESAKMVPYHHPIYLTSLWVQPMPKVSKNVVATAIKVAKKAQKWWKMAKKLLFLSHRRSFMAPKLFSHQYLLAPMIWCDFWHFRITGSIICRQILHSFTDVMKGASPFVTNASGAIWWPYLQLMQVAPSGGHICNLCKWHHLVAKFLTYASGAIWWPYLQLMQVAPSGGQFCNQCKMER